MASMGVYPGQASFDYAKIHAYKQATVDELRAGIQQLLQANKVQVIPARAQVLAPGKVQAGEEILEAKHILVATGSLSQHPSHPGGPGGWGRVHQRRPAGGARPGFTSG